MTNEEAISYLEGQRACICSEDCQNNYDYTYCEQGFLCNDVEAINMAIEALKEQPEHSQNTSSKQPDLETLCIKTGETCEDVISRQAAIDAINQICPIDTEYDCTLLDRVDVRCVLTDLPSAQPGQHTCVNCGRTVNNGGWYADGRTRCPIEEHYALPKNGYCHLWEKRNVTDDDYPERREE